MNINGSIIVLEKDGTEITDNEVLVCLKEETLMLLETGECWQPAQHEETGSTTSTLTLYSNASSPDASESRAELPSLMENEINGDESSTETLQEVPSETVPAIGSNIQLFIVSPESGHSAHTSKNSEYVWKDMAVPWDKLPSYVLKSCEEGTNDKRIISQVINVIVGEMRSIKSNIPRTAFRCLAEKMADTYPKTFLDVDEDGTILGGGISSTVSKLFDRNNYLNRPHKRKGEEPFVKPAPPKLLKTVRNSKVGCSNWQPLVEEKADKIDIIKMINSIDSSHPDFFKFLEETYPEQRQFLNSIENPPTAKETIEKWPVLFDSGCVIWHFKKLTEVETCEISPIKILKIINFGKKMNIVFNEEEDQLLSALRILSSYFKEDLSTLFYRFKVRICLSANTQFLYNILVVLERRGR